MQRLWRITLLGVKFILVLCMIGIILTTSWGVITRYVLNNAASWTGELATYLLVWVTFLGSALAVIEGGHMNFDLILGKLPPFQRKLVQIFGNLTLLYFTGILTYYGTIVSWSAITDHALTMPISKAVFYAAMPVGGLIMVIGYLLDLVRVIRQKQRSSQLSIEDLNAESGHKEVVL